MMVRLQQLVTERTDCFRIQIRNSCQDMINAPAAANNVWESSGITEHININCSCHTQTEETQNAHAMPCDLTLHQSFLNWYNKYKLCKILLNPLQQKTLLKSFHA